MASTAADDQWREEILLELSELRKSQGEIQKRVGDLTAEVTQLKAMRAKSAGALSMDLRNASFPSLGNADAPLVIVEFSDFQCPYCRLHQKNTLPALVDKYVSTGKSKYVMVDFPLGFHAHAEPAAIAAACANNQGHFWEMHDLLFENQSRLEDASFAKSAATLDLDQSKFAQCMQDSKTAALVREHVRLGESMGVHGTPDFFIGRIKKGVLSDVTELSGAKPFTSFEGVLDGLLAANDSKK